MTAPTSYGLPSPNTFAQASRGWSISYTAPAGGRRELKCGMIVDAKTQPTTQAFEWAALFSMSNYANQGEDVACYAKGFKYANGPTWAGCFEAKDFSGGNAGALYGLEVDVWANGPGNGSRFGIGFNFGSATTGEPPVIDYGIDFSPSRHNRASAALGRAINVRIDCTDAVVKVCEGASAPALLDVASAGPISALLEMSSAAPMFSSAPLGPYVGKLRVMIDGQAYALPIYGWGQP